jgi:hypothetical protein
LALRPGDDRVRVASRLDAEALSDSIVEEGAEGSSAEFVLTLGRHVVVLIFPFSCPTTPHGLLSAKYWPRESNPVRLDPYVSRALGASGACGPSAGVLAAGPVETP